MILVAPTRARVSLASVVSSPFVSMANEGIAWNLKNNQSTAAVGAPQNARDSNIVVRGQESVQMTSNRLGRKRTVNQQALQRAKR